MNRLLLVGFLFAAHTTGQDRQLALSAPQNLEFALVRSHDGVLCGHGMNYRTRFLADRIAFEPAMHSLPTPQALVLVAETMARGGRPVALPPTAPPVAEGNTVRYHRGNVVETYDVRSDGLKQSFVFHALPAGDGDLEVTLRVDTPFDVAHADSERVDFAHVDGVVRLAGVVGIDARGQSAAGSLRRDGDRMALRLPAAFVRTAALPLVLDPLLSTPTTLNALPSGQTQGSYDATTDRYVVAWRVNGAIHCLFVPGGPQVVNTGTTPVSWSIANNNHRDAFVVCWSDNVRVQAVGCTSAQVGPFAPGATTVADQVVLANNAVPTSDRMLLTLRNPAGAGSCEVRSLTVQSNLGVIIGPASVASGSGGLHGSVTGIGQSTNGGSASRYLVAWHQPFGGTTSTWFRLFDANGTAVTPASQFGGFLAGFDLDGEDGDWHVPFPAIPVAGHHVLCVRLVGSNLVTADLGDLGVLGNSVALSRVGRQLVAQTRRIASTSTAPNENYLRTVTVGNCLACQASETFPLNASSLPVMVRPTASGATDPGLAEALRMFNATGGALQMYSVALRDGQVTDLGGGCGAAVGIASAECAHIGGTHGAVLRDTSANTGFLLLSPARLDATGCGTCVLVPDPMAGWISPQLNSQPQQAQFTQAIPVPNVPGLVGMVFYEQWVVPAGNPACTALAANFSNALRVVIE